MTKQGFTELDYKKVELRKKQAKMADALNSSFVATKLGSKALGTVLEAQEDVSHRGQWIIAANASGKTAYLARECVWHFLGIHPHKPRLPEWGDQPLFIVFAGKTSTIIEEEIWKGKIKPLLPSGSYVEAKRDKECIRLVENPHNGNRILFVIHNDAANARERVQAFTCHIALLDEMPTDVSFISEMLMRLRAGSHLDKEAPLAGYWYCGFTPLLSDDKIRELVDQSKFPFKKYIFKMEDNPFYAGWTSAELDAYVRQRCQDEIEFQARRHGAWMYTNERVFAGYSPIKNRVKLPFEYSKSLLHGIIVDPAASGKVGVSLAVLAPQQIMLPGPPGKPPQLVDQWWIVKSRKLDGVAASLLVKDIEKEFTYDVNIAPDGRICDCAPSGFYKEASIQGLPYRPYRKKNDKKKESIEDVNKALYNGLLMLADTSETEELHKELLSAKWKENETEIKNSHKYHCADTVRYLWEMKPKRVLAAASPSSWGAALRQKWKEEEAAKEAAADKAKKRKQKILPSKAWARRAR